MRWQSPLALLIDERLRWRNHIALWLALTPVMVTAVLLVAMPFSPGLQLRMMERFHLSSPSFASWAMLQPVPSMYSFANEVWFSGSPMSEENLVKYPQLSHKVWCNHFPMQCMTCQHRQVAPVAPYRQFLHARSTYRDTQVFSRVELSKATATELLAFKYEENVR